jgi:hypothetical protein
MLEPALRRLLGKLSAMESDVENQSAHASVGSAAGPKSGYFVKVFHQAPRKSDTPEKKQDTGSMNEPSDYRHELQLRDDQLRREIDQRQDSFRAEQAVRDKANDERFQSFLNVQAERDKRLDESVAGIRGELSKLGSLKLSIWGAMFTGLAITLAVIGLGVTAYQAGQADRYTAEKAAPALPSAQTQTK